MGILNITPDSFSDGNRYNSAKHAFERAQRMQQAGVDIIDIGGESTRPGAAEVTVDAEIARVIPVIQRIKSLGIPISIDTSKAEVMQAAVEAGANMINDVRALQGQKALQTAASLKVPVCLMHMQGQPRSMQTTPQYQNVIEDVMEFLHQRVKACENEGIDKSLICLDPGFGFGKSLQHNLELLDQLERFNELGLPVLTGLSRKSMLGLITDQPVEQRLSASLAVAQIAMQKGARIIRVHDVAETNDVRQVFMAMKSVRSE
ncbi:MAG: dihydropteroate synthase [Flavobacteriales bacterium]|nr:dihydropteroate synthase [Flavobacteriales bacterium]